MNKYIKKVAYILVFVGLLFISNTTFAAFSFNQDKDDCKPGIGIANYNSLAGWPDSRGCWVTSSVSGQSGEYINVGLYYHNTGSASEPGVRIQLTNPGTGPASMYSFSGSIASSSGGGLSLGSVSLNLSPSQTLTYVDTLWYDQAHGFDEGDEISSTTGTDIFGSGFNLGTVGTGWKNQGYVVVKFQVGNKVITPLPLVCDITSFSANPTSVTIPGQPVTLSWTTNGYCTSVIVDGLQDNRASGTKIVYPNTTTTYYISASGNGGSDSGSAIVTVNPVSTICQITNFSAYPYNPTPGQPVTLTWDTIGATSVVVDNQTFYNTSGIKLVYPNTTTTYYMTANCNGTSDSRSTVVVVSPVSTYCQITSFIPSTTQVTTPGQAVTLSWSGIGATSFVLNGTSYPSSYTSAVVYPTVTTTYTLTSYCNGNIDTRQTIVTVNASSNYASLRTDPATEKSTVGATLNGYVNPNGSPTTRWFRYGTTPSTMYLNTKIENIGTSVQNVSEKISGLTPNTLYYFQVVANNSAGTNYNANIQSFSTNASFIAPSGSTSAVTTIATNVQQSTAQLNGLLLNTTALPTSTYFEYGTNVTMTNRTVSKPAAAGTSLPITDFISGLAPNTVYYFRANANNTDGRVFGSIQVFKTAGTATPVTPTVITRVGTESPIMLKIENRYEIFNIGDTVDYTVTYKNIGTSTLTNPLLQVVLPSHVAYTNSSRGTYAVENSTLSVPLENLAPQAEGVVYVQGKVVSLPENHSQIVTTALLNYTTPQGAQESAMAYVLNREIGGINNNLSANALFATGFWPATLCGWLLLIIIILLLVMLIRWLLARRDERTRTIYRNDTHM